MPAHTMNYINNNNTYDCVQISFVNEHQLVHRYNFQTINCVLTYHFNCTTYDALASFHTSKITLYYIGT